MSRPSPLATLLHGEDLVLNMELASAVNHFSVNALDKISNPVGFLPRLMTHVNGRHKRKSFGGREEVQAGDWLAGGGDAPVQEMRRNKSQVDAPVRDVVGLRAIGAKQRKTHSDLQLLLNRASCGSLITFSGRFIPFRSRGNKVALAPEE